MSIFKYIDWGYLTTPQGVLSARWDRLPQFGVKAPMVISGDEVDRNKDVYAMRQKKNRIRR